MADAKLIVPQKPKLLTRLRQAVAYTIAGVDGAWMSPQQPIMPQAQEQTHGRQWDYPIAFNINYIPRTTEALSFDKLRYLAENCGVLREVIETRKDQVEAMEWNIVPKKDEEGRRPKSGQYKSKINEITNFFQRPDRILDWGQWLREILEQHFVYDAVSIYRQPTKGGQLYALRVFDGSKISPKIDADGRLPEPPSVAYQQILKGIPSGDYTSDELIYFPKNVRADRVYGYPIVAQIVWYVETAIARVREQIAYYTQGNVPTGFMEGPPTMTTDQIEGMQRYWDSMFSGNIEQRAHLWWVPSGTKYSKLEKEKLFDEFDEWLARVVCYAFSISPMPFVKMMNRGTAATAQETATEEGMQPLLHYVKRLMDVFIREDFQEPDLEFNWKTAEEIDPQKSAAIDVGDATNGIRTIDEVREKRGLDAFGGACSQPMVKTANGYVPVDPQEAQDLKAPPLLPGAGAGGPGGQGGPFGKPKNPAVAGQKTGPTKKPGEKTGPQVGANKTPPVKPGATGSGQPAKKLASVYVSRPLLNPHDLALWAEGAGLGKLLNYDVHVKVGDNRDTIDWELIPAHEAPSVVLVEGGVRELAASAEGLALYFESFELSQRADDLEKAGVTFAFEQFKPHVILQVSQLPTDLKAVQPYGGKFLFGAEDYAQADVFGNLVKLSREDLNAAAANTDPNPSRAQIEAGNYRKGHVRLHGLDISIENAEGDLRDGVDRDGNPWSVVMPAHYGYVTRTIGADEDQVDVYLGPDPDSERVWVIDQLDLQTGKFDEHKAFLGFNTAEEVLDTYTSAFSDGKGFDRISGVTRMDVDGFKQWLAGADLTKPVSKNVTTHTGLSYYDFGVDDSVGEDPKHPNGDEGVASGQDTRQSVTVPPFYTQRAADSKRDKDDVDYSPGKPNTRCGECKHFRAKAPDFESGDCERVKGLIDADYWCKLFDRRDAVAKVYRSVSELPQAVKDKIKSPKRRRQWMQVWNNIFQQTGSEQRAFAGAWSATERAGGVRTTKHGHADEYARY